MPPIEIPTLNANAAKDIRSELDACGISTLPDFFPPETLKTFSEEILSDLHHASPSSGNRKYSLKYDGVKDHSLFKLVRSPAFLDLINNILDGISGKKVEADHITMGYSILKHKGNSVPGHFDSLNIMNIIIPIIIPATTSSAPSLWTLPNIISFKKTLFNRLLGQVLVRLPVIRHVLNPQPVFYKEGCLHFFYGGRTFHWVPASQSDELRVIASINVRFKKVQP